MVNDLKQIVQEMVKLNQQESANAVVPCNSWEEDRISS